MDNVVKKIIKQISMKLTPSLKNRVYLLFQLLCTPVHVISLFPLRLPRILLFSVSHCLIFQKNIYTLVSIPEDVFSVLIFEEYVL